MKMLSTPELLGINSGLVCIFLVFFKGLRAKLLSHVMAHQNQKKITII